MPDSISPVSSVSGSPSPPPTGKAVAPPPPPLGEPSVLSELDNDTSAKEPFPDLDESVPLDPPSGASSIEEARSTVHVHDIRPSRRPSLAGSTHKNLAVPSASPQPSNESRSPVLPPVPEPPKPTDDPAPEWDDEPPKKHHRSTHGPLPPPSPPSPSRHDEYKARGGRDSGDLDGASLSEAERMAAKERRAKKARSRSIAQAHPPSPPSDPQTGTHSRRMSVSHRDDKYSKTKSRRDHEREPEKASSPAKETHERPRERRGSIGGRERAEREKQKERDRIRQKEADREARKAKAAEKEKARAAAREKERERERDSTNDERTSEDDRGKEVNGDRERRGYRSRADSARTRDRGQSNDWSDDEERRDRHRRERRSSTRAREREETVRPHRRRTEDAEYDAHKVSRDTAAAAATISAAVAADGHHRRKNKVDFSDTGEESDWRGERSRNKSHNPRDVRFDEPRSRGSKPKTSRYDYNANPDGDYEYDQPRNPPISKPLPAPISQPHPSRTMSLRSRRDSQPLSPSVPEPAHEESKPRRWRDKFLRAPSLRRNKNPKPVLVPDTEPTPSPRSPTRGGRDGHGYDNRDVHIRPTSASDQRPYSPALQDETALESLSTQKLLALANNADLAHCQRIHIWLILCERKHGLHCSDEGRNTWRPSYLIDTTTYQLVEAPPGCRYAIWSYGDCDPIGDKSCKHERTTSENLDLFLTEGIPQDLIPPAYADAIWLTRKTRVQYLWIDHFCIVHDNQASRTEYVMNKPQLYANAVFTVIYAIRGLGKGLEPLDPEKDARGTGKEAARDAEDSVGLAGLQDKVSTTYWNTRAWTFGDKLYSRRALYIFPTNYVWRCHCIVRDKFEAGSPGGIPVSSLKCLSAVGDPTLAHRHTIWPDIQDYRNMVTDYSVRRVRKDKPDHFISAFTGITSLLSRSFTGGFVYGMPVMFFDIMMLWGNTGYIIPRSACADLPSWAWMSWDFSRSSVDVRLWECAETVYSECSEGNWIFRGRPELTPKFRSLVKYHLENKDGSISIALEANGLSHPITTDPSQLPPGWSRIKIKGRPKPSDGSKAPPEFGHVNYTDVTFRRPVPLFTDNEANARHLATPLPNLPILSFKAQIVDLGVKFASWITSPSGHRAALGSIYLGGELVGQVNSHDQQLVHDSDPNLSDDEDYAMEKLTFVALSEMSVSTKHHLVRDFPVKTGRMVDVVNVLWVRKEKGVFYRMGWGFVEATAWDSCGFLVGGIKLA